MSTIPRSSLVCGGALTLLALGLSQCSQSSGALTSAALHEALDAPKLYLTNSATTWLGEGLVQIPITPEDRKRIHNCLKNGHARFIPDSYYEDEDEVGGDYDHYGFYIMSSNGQPLLAHVDDDEIELDDIGYSGDTGEQLYRILKPYVDALKKHTTQAP